MSTGSKWQDGQHTQWSINRNEREHFIPATRWPVTKHDSHTCQSSERDMGCRCCWVLLKPWCWAGGYHWFLMSAALLIGHSSTPTSPAIFSPSHVSFHVLLTVANHNKVHPESSSLLIHVNKLVHVRHYDMWLKDTSQTPFGKFSKSFNNNKQITLKTR